MKLRKLALVASVLALSTPMLVQAGNTDADKKVKAGADVSATTPAGKARAGVDATASRKGAAAGVNAKADGKRSAVGATGGAAAGATGADKSKDRIR